jgi:hypothetical protein
MAQPGSDPLPDWLPSIQQNLFSLAYLRLTLEAKEPLFLPPYKGSTLRGGFGASFRKVSCVMTQQDCQTCQLNQQCAYAYIFETPRLNDIALSHQADNFPHPFIIEPPLSQQTRFHTGEQFEFRLVLIGKAIDYLPYFLLCFFQLGFMGIGRGRGKFELKSVDSFEDLALQTTRQLYDGATQKIIGTPTTFSLDDFFAIAPLTQFNAITVDFKTPTRITQNNKLIMELPFDLFMRNLLRRVSLLGRIHCGSDWDLPYKAILDQAANQVRLVDSHTTWYDWERYSNRQQTRMKMGGIIGALTYEGELEPFLPLITLGQFTHIGKNTTFGLGKYIVRRGA